jgi:hypothetical protein
MNKITLQNIVLLIGVSLVLTCATYLVNIGIFSSNVSISPSDAAFLEGVFFIIIGALLFLGSGGIGRGSQKAAMLVATASAVGKDVMGPSEIYKRDAWKPKGFTRLGLILILTGIFLLIIYFASL